VQRINAPTVVSALLATTTLLVTALLLTDPEPFAPGSAVLVTAGAWAYSLVAIAGVVLVFAPWARWLGLGTVIGELIVAALVGFGTALGVAVVVAGLAAVAGLSGPWLTIWIRQRRGTGPEPLAVALPVVALGAPIVCGLVAWSGPSVAVVVAAVIGPIAAWAFARSMWSGLWALRLVYPIAAGIAAFGLSLVGAAALVAHGITVAVLAWSPAAARAQRPVGGPLPAPRYRKGAG
jgi:hypothetical protein